MSDGAMKIGPRERNLLILLVVVALGAGAFTLLGGDDEPITLDVPTPTGSPRATETPRDRSVPPIADGPFDGRDPFVPLVFAGGGDGGSGNGGNGSTVVDDGSGTSARRIVLVDIFRSGGERRATVEVDGKTFTVTVGETFAGNFRVISLGKECGTFVFGDERFMLCIGQEALK